MRKILIIGATSAIAEATARLFAGCGDKLYLVARNRERLEMIVQDLQVRGGEAIGSETLDINDIDQHKDTLNRAVQFLGGIDIVLIAHGTLPDQHACQGNVSLTLSEMNTNAVSTIAMLTLLAEYFDQAGKGTIAVISSVAGDRGRQSNYVYGAAKAMVTIFLQGLRNRLHGSGVHVLTIKPGFVDTPMTAAFQKGFLWAKPKTIALGIVKAINKRSNEIYSPGFWRGIMILIKALPEFVFKRLNL